MTTHLEPYHQAYTYDTGNNLTHLIHQAPSSTWQQTISIHPTSNQGAESTPSITNFDPNGNLLTLTNIGTLTWHYNNSLNKLTKDDKNTKEYYIYDHQNRRVRTVLESNQQNQSQRDYLPSLDLLSINNKQAISVLHIDTHILSETSKDTTQTRYQLNGHLQSNTLELSNQAQVISFEHFYPYGGTALIAGKDPTQVKQKRYRYTGKETDDSNGLSYYGARYLAPWMSRWIGPDSAGAVNGLNLYAYVGNNPLKYFDPTGHVLEEGAVGGVSDVKTKERPGSGEYAEINEKVIQANDMKQIILQNDIFKKLGTLGSDTRIIRHEEVSTSSQKNISKVVKKLDKLRTYKEAHIQKMTDTGVSYIDAFIQFDASDKYKKMIFKKYKVANCGECSAIMLHELNKQFPHTTIETLDLLDHDHVFNLVNRDQSTSVFEPSKWNKDTIIVDAWLQSVYTQEEFISTAPQSDYNFEVAPFGKAIRVLKHEDTLSGNLFQKPNSE